MNPSEHHAPPRAGVERFGVAKLFVLGPLAWLRFVFILGAIALVIVNWDLLLAYYDKIRGPSESSTVAGDVEYYCPMHPTIVRDNNKEKCPICFMPLSKRKKGEFTDEALPAGTVARVQLSPYRIVLPGVRTTPVGYHTLHKEITTVGTVEFNERQLRKVSARFKARIDKLFVNETGQTVNKGDPLASLYSPDLVVTVQNLLDARRVKDADSEKDSPRSLAAMGDRCRPDRRHLESGQADYAFDHSFADRRPRHQEVSARRAVCRRRWAALRCRGPIDGLGAGPVVRRRSRLYSESKLRRQDRSRATAACC